MSSGSSALELATTALRCGVHFLIWSVFLQSSLSLFLLLCSLPIFVFMSLVTRVPARAMHRLYTAVGRFRIRSVTHYHKLYFLNNKFTESTWTLFAQIGNGTVFVAISIHTGLINMCSWKHGADKIYSPRCCSLHIQMRCRDSPPATNTINNWWKCLNIICLRSNLFCVCARHGCVGTCIELNALGAEQL